MKTILAAIGTRPEAIKLAPILKALMKIDGFRIKTCITWQHTDLLTPFLHSLGIITDFAFMNTKRGSLQQSAVSILEQFGDLLTEIKPDLIIVQGDTTTAFHAALAGFYASIPIAHVEAGLRTDDPFSPWPEEAHRNLIDKLSTFFFAPTIQARDVLLSEGISPNRVWVVGNTSIDAIKDMGKPTHRLGCDEAPYIVVTVHRRENQGANLEEICHALQAIAQQFPKLKIVCVLHANPSIREPLIENLSEVSNITLQEPTDHFSFIDLLDRSLFVLTDSGGVQEEAPYLGKPLLILRDTTERPEGVQAKTARLVGTSSESIIDNCRELLENKDILSSMSKIHFPYGDGQAADRIAAILESELCEVFA